MNKKQSAAKDYLVTFFDEKNLDREKILTAIAPRGTENLIETGVVIDAILQTSGAEQVKIAEILRKIDFANGDVYHFLTHLAGAMAYDL